MHPRTYVWCLLGSAVPAVLAASTTTVTMSRSCPNPSSSNSGLSGGPGGNSAGASMQSGSGSSGGSVTSIPPGCTTTDCAPAASSIPNCASACLAEVATTFECATDDYECACYNQPYYAEGAEPCISTACPSASYLAVASAVNGLCSCASASSSDLACIASYTAGAQGRSGTAGSPSSNSNAATSSNSAGVQSTGAATSVGGSGSQSAANTNSGSSNSQSAAATSSNGQSNSAAATTSSGSNSAAATTSNNGGAASTNGFIAPITAPNALYGNCPYSTTITDSLSNVRTIPTSVFVEAPSVLPTAEATYTYIGCFVDFNGERVVDGTLGYQLSNATSGVGECLDFCVGAGAEFAAVAAFGECLCSNNINEQEGCADRCYDICNGEADAICGGASAAQVYATVPT